MADKNIISTSKKEIYTKLLDIAGKYVDVKNSDFAQTGLFGYIMESMAMAMRDSAFHTGMMYNESFLNTAVIPKSVYNWAKMFNIEVQKAEPAYANITISIPEDMIESNMKEITDNNRERFGYDLDNISYGILLDKEDPIIAGDYYFSLEHSIVIYINTADSSDSKASTYAAKHILSEYSSTNYQEITPINQQIEIQYNNGNYVIKGIKIYQYRLNKYDRQLTSVSFLNKIQKFQFEDQFCGVKLFSLNNGVRTEINVQYSDLKLPSGVETAFYNLADENELEIIFKYGNDKYYSPGSNSNLVTYIYTTKGRNIPKTFNGTAIMLISNTTFKNLPMTITFNDGNIIGGSNIPTLSSVKETIINELSTRNTITTQADLNNFFAVLTTLISTINDGKVLFIKQRDDIIKRLYNAYLLIRDNTDDILHTTAASDFISSCVPTNTISITHTENNQKISTNGEENIIDIKYGRFIKGLDGQWISVSDSSVAANDDYYICPFRIKVLTRPVETIKYIYDLVSSSSKLLYESAGSGAFFSKNYFIPSSISLKKSNTTFLNTNEADSYIFEISVVSNVPLKANTISGSLSFTIGGKVADVPVDNNNIDEPEENNGVYTNIIRLTATSHQSNSYFSAIDLSFNGLDAYKVADVLSESSISLDFTNFKINNVSLNNLKFKTEDPLVFFQELDDVMESTISVSVTQSETGASSVNNCITIHDVPVIHSSFLNEQNTDYLLKLEGFTNQLFTYINMLKDNLNRLETSTFFSLKFYNTYGESYKYDTTKTNIDLQLKIKLIDLYANNDSLKSEIRSYIRRLVDKTNEYGDGLRYSDIVSALMQSSSYGKYINHITFAGINDSYNQYIAPIAESDSYTNISSTTPEWLNLDASTINDCIVFE